MTALPFLYQGEDYLAVDKPAGVLVIPGRGEEGPRSLREVLEEQLGRKVFVVHRLDRDTSGVVLFALSAPVHRTLSMAFEEGVIEKTYQALVEGRMEAPREVTVGLVPARRGRMRPGRPGEDAKAAQTLFRPLEVFKAATLVEALPRSGRTHQIRVHLSTAGHPLLFDHQYGRDQPVTASDLGGEGEAVVLQRTPLHAVELRIPKLAGLHARTVRSPLPPDLTLALSLLRGQREP